ncbi:MAG TPA: RHS repeat-associated core domain-containing protein [Pyrinomonadaceae bacterium]|nr:RHS repeat-associated core domain-containing protein [Pyrinomonadaceae bacterium]
MNRIFVALSALLLFCAGIVEAQTQHPNQARGFNANGVYSSNDLDHINLFNGNLTVAIPVGQPYPVNGQLSYSFSLVYNSSQWSPREVCPTTVDQTQLSSVFFSLQARTNPFGVVSETPHQIGGLNTDQYDPVPARSSPDQCWTIQDPNPATNAGLGWQLTFGKLYNPRFSPYDDRPNYTEKSTFVYMSPDGSEHTFYQTLHEDDPASSTNVWYTRDGSYLRLTTNLNPQGNAYLADMMIEFPNGQKHYFQNLLVRVADQPHFITEVKEEKLRGIEDPYGNYVRIDYVDTDNDGVADDRWLISDSAGRHHQVNFSRVVNGYQKVIQNLQLQSVNGLLTTYALTYATTVDINRPLPHVTESLISESTNTLKAPLLTAVQLPAVVGSQYSMPVDPNDLTNAAYDVPGLEAANTGLLKRLVLPTGGIIEWKYRTEDPDADKQAGYGYKYGIGAAARHYLRSSVGVRRRTVTINKGTVTEKSYTWKYDPKVGENYPSGCQQLTPQTVCAPAEIVTKLTTPEGDYTLNYFSVYPYPYGGQGVSADALRRGRADLHSADYALPFTKDPRPQPNGNLPPRGLSSDAWTGYPLFLSQAIFDKSNVLKRSIYVRYDTDVLSLNDGYGQAMDSNARLAATRTVYHDDGATYAETQYLDFDGLGHYRQENILGNFGSGDRRLNIVWYNRANGSYSVEPSTNARTTNFIAVSESSPWLLETYDSKVSSDFVKYRSTTYFSFNPQGAIQAKRSLKNLETPNTAYVLTSKDVLVTYSYDATGNLTEENHYGGDVAANASTGDRFLPTGASEYAITNSYRCDIGGNRTTSVVSSSYYKSTPSLKLLDNTVDCTTGTVTASRDAAGIQTSYEYDELGRVTRVAPQQGAVDKIKYFDVQAGATTGAPQISVDHVAQDAASTSLGDEVFKYDQLGRLFEQRERMPNAGSVYKVKTMAYNGMGWKTAESEWNDGTTASGRQTKYDDFDPFGRPATIYQPDYTAANRHLVKVFYNGVRLVNRTVRVGTQVVAGSSVTIDEADAVTVETYDRQGRLAQVREASGANGANVTTSYDYNINNQIVTATTPAQLANGAQLTQTRTFGYDNLGNLRYEYLPEVPYRAYDNFDSLGHIGTEFTGKSYLRYLYDFAGRLTRVEEESGSQYRPIKDYAYYTANSANNYSLGKVQIARRYNWVANPYTLNDPNEQGVVVREDFVYGGVDGALSKKTTRLNAETEIVNHTINQTAYTFDQTFTYDPRGNLISQTYPQCTNATCVGSGMTRPWRTNYTYKSNWLVKAGGGAGTTNANDAAYSPAISYYTGGMTSSILHGNGVTDTFAPDPNYLPRYASITFRNGGNAQLWASGNYSYDGAGNITKQGSDWFAYDKVGRVVEGTSLDAGGKKRRYSYDAFGNVTDYQTYANVTAGGGNPALVDNFVTNSQSTTNRLNLSYDGAGNALGLAGQPALYTYDAVNMVKYAPGFTYLYTSDDERIWSLDKAALSGTDKLWVDDNLPTGAVASGSNEGWNWASFNPAPSAGSLEHQSISFAGVHQHFFTGATNTLKVAAGDSLFAYVYIDPQSLPSEVMLQWFDAATGWEHRAYWGQDKITTFGSRVYRGALPAAGSWQRLEVPAAALGLEGATITGMAFTLFDGRASWDRAGVKSTAIVETITLRGLQNQVLREYQVSGGDANNHWFWLKDNVYLGARLLASESPQGTRHYHLDHLGTPKVITDASGNPLPGAPYTNFPFGEDTSGYPPYDGHTPPSDEKLRFAGQEKNFDYSGLGLYYMHARYYLPGSAKFLSVDPGRDSNPKQPQSWNLYSYTRNSPINANDPDGKEMSLIAQKLQQEKAWNRVVTTKWMEWNANNPSVYGPTNYSFFRCYLESEIRFQADMARVPAFSLKDVTPQSIDLLKSMASGAGGAVAGSALQKHLLKRAAAELPLAEGGTALGGLAGFSAGVAADLLTQTIAQAVWTGPRASSWRVAHSEYYERNYDCYLSIQVGLIQLYRPDSSVMDSSVQRPH